ncbi:MAG: hypothetical protein AAF367_11805 [Pseudomonadota bacterium]
MLVSVLRHVLLSFAAGRAQASWIERRFDPGFGTLAGTREETQLLPSKTTKAVFLVGTTAIFALSDLTGGIAPLIAAAGVRNLLTRFRA